MKLEAFFFVVAVGRPVNRDALVFLLLLLLLLQQQ